MTEQSKQVTYWADKAREHYLKAWRGLDARAEYRQIVAVKLAALGVDAKTEGAGK